MDEVSNYMLCHQFKIASAANAFAIWCLVYSVIFCHLDGTLPPVCIRVTAWTLETSLESREVGCTHRMLSRAWFRSWVVFSPRVSKTLSAMCGVGGPGLMPLGAVAEKLSYSRDEYNYNRDLTLY